MTMSGNGSGKSGGGGQLLGGGLPLQMKMGAFDEDCPNCGRFGTNVFIRWFRPVAQSVSAVALPKGVTIPGEKATAMGVKGILVPVEGYRMCLWCNYRCYEKPDAMGKNWLVAAEQNRTEKEPEGEESKTLTQEDIAPGG